MTEGYVTLFNKFGDPLKRVKYQSAKHRKKIISDWGKLNGEYVEIDPELNYFLPTNPDGTNKKAKKQMLHRFKPVQLKQIRGHKNREIYI